MKTSNKCFHRASPDCRETRCRRPSIDFWDSPGRWQWGGWPLRPQVLTRRELFAPFSYPVTLSMDTKSPDSCFKSVETT